MPLSGTIALVRACGFGPLPDMIEEQAGERAILDIFRDEGVPLLVRSQPDTPMPLAAMAGLFSRGARLLGDRLFGLEVGERMSHQTYGMWAEYASQGTDLAEGLRRSIITSGAHLSGARLELVPHGDRWIWRFVMPHCDVDRTHHADHLLPPMLSFVRQYLGRNWRPERITLSYRRDAEAHLLEEKLQVPLTFEQDGTGIVLRPEELSYLRASQGQRRRLLTLQDIRADVVLRDAPEPARALAGIVTMRLLDGHSDIEGAARLAGMSVQTLQRQLRQKGYTYREIVDAARRARAVSLLCETHQPLVEIAFSLGYEDQANFTRAFIRWFGQPPSALRQSRRGSTPMRVLSPSPRE